MGQAAGTAVAGVAIALGVSPAVAALGVVAAIGVVGYGMGQVGAWAGRGIGRALDGRTDQTGGRAGPSTAQEAATTYSGGDLNGEFSGTSVGDGNGNPSGEGADDGGSARAIVLMERRTRPRRQWFRVQPSAARIFAIVDIDTKPMETSKG